MSAPTDPTEEPTITERGFMEFRPFNVWQDRATVQVCESSSAEGCKIWLSVTDLAGEATVQVDVDDALRLVRQVVYLLDHHHNADESEPAPPTSVEEPWAALRAMPEYVALVAALSDDPPKLPCSFCDGTGEVEDENWSPEYQPATRTYRDGIIDCGWCEGDGWVNPNPIDAARALVAAVEHPQPEPQHEHDASAVGCWCWDQPDLTNPHPRRCPDQKPHATHDWWDEHEPDASKWRCVAPPSFMDIGTEREDAYLDDLSARITAAAPTPEPPEVPEGLNEAVAKAVYALGDHLHPWEDASPALHDAYRSAISKAAAEWGVDRVLGDWITKEQP